MPARKFIRDPIHGDIFITEREFEAIDTPEFQRLRRIKQLGMAFMVYPSANHTRFEHSLGALHLAGRIADRLGLEEGERRDVRLAALLHDMGHGPLSHTSEELLVRYLGLSHEEVAEGMLNTPRLAGILEAAGADPMRVGRIIAGGEGYLGKVVNGEFDVDRMDYLVRDSHHTGVAYGIIDLDRIINTLEVSGSTLAVGERGLRAVEGLLVARFLMTPTVYLHHTSRIADAMFLRATEKAIWEGRLDYKALCEMDDYDLQNIFRAADGYVGEIGARFDERRLFKKALGLDWPSLGEDLREDIIGLREDVKRWRAMEDRMASDVGLEPGYVLLDIPPLPEYEEMEALILRERGSVRIEEASPLVKILREAQLSQWGLGVYTTKERLEDVSKLRLSDYF